MNADVFFTIGSTHKICQDYAVGVKDDPEHPFVIVSDGCSSAPDTDFGSRLIVKAAQPHVNKECFNDIDAFLYGVLSNASTFCRTLQLPDESLCATLLVARINENNFETLVVGDGLVVAKSRRDGMIYVCDYEFKSGAPYYLRYELNEDIKKSYFDEFGQEGSCRSYCIEPDGKISEEKELPFDFGPDKIFFQNLFPISEWESVGVISDGANSFVKQKLTSTTKTNEPVANFEIVKEVMAFKGYTGEFVQRRCNRAFKSFRDQGMQNCDDFSIGVISNKEEKS
jgi:hypothetical protein